MVISWNTEQDGERNSLDFTLHATYISRSDNDMYDHMNNSIYNFL